MRTGNHSLQLRWMSSHLIGALLLEHQSSTTDFKLFFLTIPDFEASV